MWRLSIFLSAIGMVGGILGFASKGKGGGSKVNNCTQGLQSINNFYVLESGTTAGEKKPVVCVNGYDFGQNQRNATAECINKKNSFEWDFGGLKCQPDCPSEHFGRASVYAASYNRTASVTCPNEHVPDRPEIQCGENGGWRHRPKCIFQCPIGDEEIMENIRSIVQDGVQGKTVVCQDDSVKTSQTFRLICDQTEEKWKDTERTITGPICIYQCVDKEIPNGHLEQKPGSVHGKLACDNGYKDSRSISGLVCERTAGLTYERVGNDPICSFVCPEQSVQVPNAIVKPSKSESLQGEVTCDNGYKKTASPFNITCNTTQDRKDLDPIEKAWTLNRMDNCTGPICIFQCPVRSLRVLHARIQQESDGMLGTVQCDEGYTKISAEDPKAILTVTCHGGIRDWVVGKGLDRRRGVCLKDCPEVNSGRGWSIPSAAFNQRSSVLCKVGTAHPVQSVYCDESGLGRWLMNRTAAGKEGNNFPSTTTIIQCVCPAKLIPHGFIRRAPIGSRSTVDCLQGYYLTAATADTAHLVDFLGSFGKKDVALTGTVMCSWETGRFEYDSAVLVDAYEEKENGSELLPKCVQKKMDYRWLYIAVPGGVVVFVVILVVIAVV